MKANLLLLILGMALWFSAGCSSPGGSRTNTPAPPQGKQWTSAVGTTKITRSSVNPNLLLKRRVLDLFQQDKVSERNALVESFQQDFEKDFRKEMVLEEAFGAFSAYDASMENRLHKWVQHHRDLILHCWLGLGRAVALAGPKHFVHSVRAHGPQPQQGRRGCRVGLEAEGRAHRGV
ncbi:MAG: hypothetical protein EXQ58_08805 [Acidobacteria bacterium]|nr:hypothetical protein [Acidobacteriota bacterium]